MGRPPIFALPTNKQQLHYAREEEKRGYGRGGQGTRASRKIVAFCELVICVVTGTRYITAKK